MNVFGREIKVVLMFSFPPFSFKLFDLLAYGNFLKIIWDFQCIVLSGYLARLSLKL